MVLRHRKQNGVISNTSQVGTLQARQNLTAGSLFNARKELATTKSHHVSFHRVGNLKYLRLTEVLADDHQADRLIVMLTAGNGNRGMAGDVERTGVVQHLPTFRENFHQWSICWWNLSAPSSAWSA